MKKHLLLILLVVWINLPAQIQFQAHTVTENTNNTILDVKKSISGDIDNDGDNDIVVYTESGEVLTLFNNGNGQFSNPVSVLKTYHITDIVLADIDSDGHLDLGVYTTDRKHIYGSISLYSNFGQGNFTSDYTFHDSIGDDDPVDSSGNFPIFDIDMKMVFADINNDGYNDLITKLGIYINDGLIPQSHGIHYVNHYSHYYKNILKGDINNDGKIDLLVYRNDYIAWLENPGNITPISSFYDFNEHTLNFNSGVLFKTAKLYDMDNDNDLDLIVSYIDNGTSKILWKENDGNGNFTTDHIIDNNNFADSIWITDTNGDNQKDLIVKTGFTIKYYLNSTQGTGFTEHFIVNDSISAIDVNDYNNDTYPDIFYFNNQTQTSYVLLNNGNGFDNPTQVTQTGYNASDIAVADTNNDNQNELIFASKLPAKISRFTNLSQTPQEHIINDTIPTKLLAVADFDNDNDIDIFSASNGILLANNNNNFLPSTSLYNGDDYHYAGIIDFNNDNVMDILLSSYYMVDALFKNGQNYQLDTFTPYVACNNSERDFSKPIIFDINNDGVNDFIFYNNWTKTLAIFYYDNNYYNSNFINFTGYNWGHVYDMEKIDINNDGLKDIIIATQAGIFTLENQGNFNFVYAHNISHRIFYHLKTADLDDDGDIDIIAAGDQIPKLGWLENNGTGSFNNIHAIGNSNDEITKIIATDYDGDGDTDIFATSDYKGKVVFYENGLYSSINQLDMNKIAVYPNPANKFIEITSKDGVNLTRISIYNISGQKIYETSKTNTTNKINVSKLSSGIYFIRFVDIKGKRGIYKFIKK